MKNSLQTESGKVRIFCTHIVRDGQIIYPKNGKVFSFLVDAA